MPKLHSKHIMQARIKIENKGENKMIVINVYLNKILKRFDAPISYDYNERTNVLTVIGRENKMAEIGTYRFNISNSSFYVVFGEYEQNMKTETESDVKPKVETKPVSEPVEPYMPETTPKKTPKAKICK